MSKSLLRQMKVGLNLESLTITYCRVIYSIHFWLNLDVELSMLNNHMLLIRVLVDGESLTIVLSHGSDVITP